MIIQFRSSFLRDIKKIKESRVKSLIRNVIEQSEKAESISEIKGCEALTSRGDFYKIKKGNYRFGVEISNNTIEFLKFGTRENFYKDFPPF